MFDKLFKLFKSRLLNESLPIRFGKEESKPEKSVPGGKLEKMLFNSATGSEPPQHPPPNPLPKLKLEKGDRHGSQEGRQGEPHGDGQQGGKPHGGGQGEHGEHGEPHGDGQQGGKPHGPQTGLYIRNFGVG